MTDAIVNGTPPRDKTAAVALEAWKLPVFERHLKAAGYTFEGPFPLSEGTLILRVAYAWAHDLAPVIQAAYAECATMKPH